MDELATAFTKYMDQWRAFADSQDAKLFFRQLAPMSLGWKVDDLAELDRRMTELRDLSGQIHYGWVNERWLVTAVLKQPLVGDVRLIKLMQKRPGSADPSGLDHVDFLVSGGTDAHVVLATEPGVRWTDERNGDHCHWVSVWFDDHEAKLRSDTVLQACADELLESQANIVAAVG
jgi:hypothetical protein